MSEITDKLKKLNLRSYIYNTCNTDFLASFLKQLEPPVNAAIEIGTMQGLGTAAMTQGAKKVYTFDVNLRNAEHVWNLLGVRDKICMFVGNNSEAIWQEIHNRLIVPRNLKTTGDIFNFAFIDGNHLLEAVRYDFEMVKFCGRVLFHDTENHKRIGNFVKGIGGKSVYKDFGYWEG